jgi:hypothetical protein
MSTQVWVAGVIRFLSFPGIANVVLTGCGTACGRCEESSGQIHRSTCTFLARQSRILEAAFG